jgi:arylsulfatase A-like enzyme
MPGWIIEDDTKRSSSNGGYNYDRHVPLIIYGGGVKPGVVDRVVSITEVAPTICKLIGISAPWASSAQPLREIKYR